MSTWVALHKLPGGREIDVNLDRVATIRRDLRNDSTNLSASDWEIEVTETPDEIRALRALQEGGGLLRLVTLARLAVDYDEAVIGAADERATLGGEEWQRLQAERTVTGDALDDSYFRLMIYARDILGLPSQLVPDDEDDDEDE